MRGARRTWGFLAERIDARIAVSRMAAESAARWLGAGLRDRPERRRRPRAGAEPAGASTRSSSSAATTRARDCPCCCAPGRRSAARSGARLRLIGTDPLQYRLLHSRLRFDEDGIDVLGIVTNDERDRELASAKLFVSPALGGESFGMVLVEAFAQATPVVASNIPGFADVAVPEAATLVPPGDDARARRRGRRRARRRAAARRDGPRRAARSSRSATPGRTSRAGSRRSTSGSPA